MARLDRLAPVKEVAQIAACIGREFDHALLAAVAQIPEPRLVDALDQFLGVGLVFHRGAPSDAAYSFKHALVRDAAYASLLRSRRRQLHARIANAIEATRPQVAAYQPELLAHHLTEAGLPGRAVIYALSAGRLAKGRHAVQEATSQLESCLRLAAQIGEDAEPTVRATTRDCLVQLGDLASMAEDLERANAYYDRAVALAGDEAERSLVWGRRHCLGYAQRGRARLAFYDHGSGEPTIVFLNPIVYGLATFQAILERLCQEFRIITVDCRGAGRSDPLHRPYGVRQHMEDLRAIVEAAGAAPIVGVGISRGSNVLVHLAHDHPRLIARLVLVGMPLIGTPLEGRPAFDPEYLERRREYYLRGDTEELLRLQARFVYTEPDSDELRRLAEDRCRQLPIDTFLSFYDPDPDMDIVPLLGSLAVPTLVMHGRADRLVAFASGEFVAASIPGAELYGFEGKGHLPSFSATDEFCGALRNFVRTGRAQPLAVRDKGEARSSGRRCRHRPASQPAHVSSGKVG
jgi:pimeloyl-ACP methyl ester carboxylesterase